MAKFEIICTARATIRETWHVEAENDEIARDQFEEDGGAFAAFIGDEVMGEEDERVIESVLPLEPRPDRNDGPYRPELAEAFRIGARDVFQDFRADGFIDVPDATLVEEGEGGCWVTIRVYVSDAERAPIADDDDGCPKSDPDCMGNNGDCHDACQSSANITVQEIIDRAERCASAIEDRIQPDIASLRAKALREAITNYQRMS